MSANQYPIGRAQSEQGDGVGFRLFTPPLRVATGSQQGSLGLDLNLGQVDDDYSRPKTTIPITVQQN